MKAVLFSDVHLDVAEAARPQRDRFTRFLRGLPAGELDRLVVLGDLFDFWFEYRHVVFSGYFEVLRAFAALRDAGVALDFVCGNHDFWAGRFLRDELGFQVHPDAYTTEWDGKRVLLMHGDGLNRRDVGYRVYKRIARAKPVVWAFGKLHPDWAMGLAQRVSRTSRRLTQAPNVKTGPEACAVGAHARHVLASGKADVVFSGHTHSPVREEHDTPSGKGLYINTGDWLWHASYAEWDDGDCRLALFEAVETEPESTTET